MQRLMFAAASSSASSAERSATLFDLKSGSMGDVQRWLALEPIASCSNAELQRIRVEMCVAASGGGSADGSFLVPTVSATRHVGLSQGGLMFLFLSWSDRLARRMAARHRSLQVGLWQITNQGLI